MVTVPHAVEKIIKRSRYLTEAMGKDLINASSLARYIHPEVEAIVMKPVTRGSILMAIQRFEARSKAENPSSPLLEDAPDMIVRSNLTLVYVKNSPQLLTELSSIEAASKDLQKRVLFSYGRSEALILANKLTAASLSEILSHETVTKEYADVSAITIHLPQTAIDSAGILNLFIKSLAWEHISILGMLLTHTELTFVFYKTDVHNAFGIFQSLFNQS